MTSGAFGRSRRAAERLMDDPAGLRRLAERAALKHLPDDGTDVRTDRSAAVRLVRALSDQCIAGRRMVHRSRDSVTAVARQRLVVAALHYLVERDDVIHDTLPNGSTDDLVILHEVFQMAEAEIAPHRLGDHASTA
ncbi:hypothetical protein [Janibacter sp. G56]